MSSSNPSRPSRGSTIEVLYFDGCPSYEHAVALVRKPLAAERITAPIQLIRVDTDVDAQHYGFYGSPTIRVNGEDIAPLPAGATPHLACRVYRTPDGQLAPVPAYETLVAALQGEHAAPTPNTARSNAPDNQSRGRSDAMITVPSAAARTVCAPPRRAT